MEDLPEEKGKENPIDFFLFVPRFWELKRFCHAVSLHKEKEEVYLVYILPSGMATN